MDFTAFDTQKIKKYTEQAKRNGAKRRNTKSLRKNCP